MGNRSFLALVAGTSLATFAGVFTLYGGAPAVAQAGAQSAASTGRAMRSAWYPNCDTAGAAGAAPLRRGDAGYRSALDRDGDGIACEPYLGNGRSWSGGRRRRR